MRYVSASLLVLSVVYLLSRVEALALLPMLPYLLMRVMPVPFSAL